MKKIIASASLAALGAATLHAAHAPGLLPQAQSKPWTISGAVRGFYDDNYTTSPSDTRRESFGLELTPSLAVNIALDQTLIGFSYTYSMRFYEDRDSNTADHSHHVLLKLDHSFNDRFRLKVSESFIASQEPEVIEEQGVITSMLRNDGDNIRNVAKIDFEADVTHNIGIGVGYANTIYDYEQDGPGSRSAILDRMEHLAHLDARWQATPSTVGILGYQFGVVNHTRNQSTAENVPFPFAETDPEYRDNRSHYFYVGADQNFTSQLNASIRLGAQFTDYPNADEDEVGPYVDGSVQWMYNPGSYLQGGIRHTRNQTDIAFQFSPTPTLDQESTAVYVVVNHRINPRLTGSLLGHYQHSTFNGGFADGEVDLIFLAGVNLAYQINPFLSAEAGYNYDRLDSDLSNRSYTRNRVYVGLRASY